MIARFLRKLLSIKPSEQQEIFYLFMTLLVFSVGASFARSIGMTLLVENLGGEKLPLMFIFIDLSVMMGSMLYARYTNKFSGLNILGFFLLSTALFSVIAQLLCTLTTYWWPQQNWVYGFFFVGFYFFYILISIHTGSVVASYFTAVEARRVTPIINAGIPIGGALGGGILIVLLNVFQFHPQQLILVLALACLGAFWLARIINAKPIRTGNNAQSVVQKNLLRDLIAAFKNIITSKLMIYMSLGLMLFVIGNKLLEYHYQTIIYYQVFPDPTRRATFFATYEVFANLAWLFVQLFLTSRLLVKWSVGASNVLYPVLSATAALALFIYF
jgi:ATP/ADP translocase